MEKKPIAFYIERILAFVVAFILIETLYYKFTGHPNSMALFTALGMEPWGRIGTGVLEFVAGGLLLFRAVSFHGALLALGLMGGAILSHLGKLGVEFNGDGGQLFYRAVIAFVLSGLIIVLRKKDVQKFIAEAKKA